MARVPASDCGALGANLVQATVTGKIRDVYQRRFDFVWCHEHSGLVNTPIISLVDVLVNEQTISE